ncbi:MAG: organomercurial lyase [Candidatus Limnocylindrales bacterium]
MNEADLDLRNLTYHRFVEEGRAPTAAELATATGQSVAHIRDGWRRLHEAHALVLDRDRRELLMANPFAARSTPYQVIAGGRSWYANCAWDAFGICAALKVDGEIRTSCRDCQSPIRINVRNEYPDDEGLLFHVLVPAIDWWRDIGFT